MGIDLSGRGFVIENEWYWRITENATTFTATAAVRDFLAPLARLAKDLFALGSPAADADDRGVTFTLGDAPVAIRLIDGGDRVAINHFVGDLDRALAVAKLGHVFALTVPRRYELRGVLLTDAELAQLAGDPTVLIPSTRPSWRAS